MSDPKAINIKVIDSTNHEIQIFNSMFAASLFTGIDITTINNRSKNVVSDYDDHIYSFYSTRRMITLKCYKTGNGEYYFKKNSKVFRRLPPKKFKPAFKPPKIDIPEPDNYLNILD